MKTGLKDNSDIFPAIRQLLESFHPPLEVRKNTKDYYDLWSNKPIVIANRNRKDVFFAAVIQQKDYVGFHFMPVYTDSEAEKFFLPELLALKKGKSCFHIRKLDLKILRQIDSVLKKGFRLYKQRGWI